MKTARGAPMQQKWEKACTGAEALPLWENGSENSLGFGSSTRCGQETRRGFGMGSMREPAVCGALKAAPW